MNIYKFLKLQWIKRRLLIIGLAVSSIGLFSLAISHNTFSEKILNILTGDQYYTTFTVLLPAKNEMTNLLIKDLKSWDGVVQISALNTKKIIREMKNESIQYGLDLPSLITDKPSELYNIKLDPFLNQEKAERIRSQIVNYFSEGDAIASPMKTPDLVAQYNPATIFLMKYGTDIIAAFLALLIIILNSQLFLRIVKDANVLQSIYRSKALSLKNYLVVQVVILSLATVVNILLGSFSMLVVLIWITLHTILALGFYGMWGKNTK